MHTENKEPETTQTDAPALGMSLCCTLADATHETTNEEKKIKNAKRGEFEVKGYWKYDNKFRTYNFIPYKKTNTMYVDINRNTECSKCGAKNFTETVLRDFNTILRCRLCRHEQIIGQCTLPPLINTAIVQDPIIYNSENYNTPLKF